MMTSNAISGTANPAFGDSSVSNRIPIKQLEQNDFLKLLVSQLTNQDPMNPLKDTEFIAQMTQFTTLEQTKSMQADMAQMRAQSQVQQAMSLLGREVLIKSPQGQLVPGVVNGFNLEGTTPKLLIGDAQYDLSAVVTIRLPNQTLPTAN